MSPTSIFAPVSAPAQAIADLSVLVLAVTAAIFVVVCVLLIYALVRFRQRRDDASEPPQVFVCAKSPEAVTLEIVSAALPPLVSVTDCGALGV